MYRLFTFVNRKRRMQTCWQFPLRFTPRFMKECMRVHLGIYACTLRNVCVHTYNICIHASFLHMRVHLQHIYACTLTTYLCVYTYNISMPVHLQHIYACTLTTYLCVYTYNISIHASIFTFANRVCKNAKVLPELRVLQCVVVCCSVLRCAKTPRCRLKSVCCSVFHYVAVCCSVLQCVAVCCSVQERQGAI